MQQPTISRIEILYKRAQKIERERQETEKFLKLRDMLSEEQMKDVYDRMERLQSLKELCEYRARCLHRRALRQAA